jgi:ATP-dependent exoDNAse (exonuclease V) beta subunit
MTQALPHTLIRASAGSGKTHQLTNRYLRLIADGVEPHSILATTFTRKAAGEILDRILSRLAEAAVDPTKAVELAGQIGVQKSEPAYFASLLRRLVEQLHRLRIGTLDSFHIALGGSFANELGLPPGWTICEETDEAAMRRDAIERLLEDHPDQIHSLFVLITQSDSQRSIHETLVETIDEHYSIFRQSPASAWSTMAVPPPASLAQQEGCIEQLRSYDMSKVSDSKFVSARDNDIEQFESGRFAEFFAKGISAKVQAGESKFNRTQIPDAVRKLYGPLLQHARHELLKPIAERNRATWELLDRFHHELSRIKQARARLRFDDVTLALVETATSGSIGAEALAYRMDGAVDHLLLDEFQDTSLPQWRVFEPIARNVTQPQTSATRSFFCVGDVKQAIYGWRGGLSAVFDQVPKSLQGIHEDSLATSRRSQPPIIDTVNKVFQNLGKVKLSDRCKPGIDSWAGRFQKHDTVRKDSGYARMESGPAQIEGELAAQYKGRHLGYAAGRIRQVCDDTPGRTVGVLCRTNDAVARMIFELRRLGVHASEEGGSCITDSAAVDLLLSLMTLADHPGHSNAWHHLKHSPLAEHLRLESGAANCAARTRRELLKDGYGAVMLAWAKRLAPACDRRELSRLQQLVELAFAYQEQSTLRPSAFVDWVRAQRSADPLASRVRVLTMHSAKGLEFDVVALPELDAGLIGKSPAFVAGRDDNLGVNSVCRYVDKKLQDLLDDQTQSAFNLWEKERVEESLSLLYVAITRAKHALYLFVPGTRIGRSENSTSWYQILCQTLAPKAERGDQRVLYEHGDATWASSDAKPSHPAVVSGPVRDAITFRPATPKRLRGLERIAPSRRTDGGIVRIRNLLERESASGRNVGTLVHAWFALIDWLDNGAPTREQLRTEAMRVLRQSNSELATSVDRLIEQFQATLQKPEISQALSRHDRREPRKVETERAFAVLDGDHLLHGSIDRLVRYSDSAEILDFKTDTIANEQAIMDKAEEYRPQLESYRRAASLMYRLPENKIRIALVFTGPGRVVEL